mgnify:CR=1 FL=1
MTITTLSPLNVQSRIVNEAGLLCGYIKLSDEEDALYTGCGLAIAQFINGTLVELFYASGLWIHPQWAAAENSIDAKAQSNDS